MTELARLKPADQYQALVNSEHTAELVRAMAPQDLHAIALAVGKEEAHELLPYCNGEQLVGLTDLSGWQGFRFDLVGYEDWLTAMFESGIQTIATYLKTADIEQLLLYMNHRMRVHEADEEGDFPTLPNAVPNEALWYSPDRKFCLEILDWLKDHDRLPSDPIRPLLKTLEGMDPFRLSRVLAALRWELATPLEEDCLQLRNARMEEMGFPPLEEAVILFARGRPKAILHAGQRTLPKAAETAPALTLRIQKRNDLLATGLAGLDDSARAHVLQELAYTANQLMVAQGAAVGDPESVQTAWNGLRATISLALEFVVRSQTDDEEQALSRTPESLRNHSLQSLFRTGFNLTVPLQDLARRIQRDPRSGPGRTAHWLSEENQLLVQGLAQGQPVILDARHEQTPLERLSELQDLALRLQQQLDVMVGVFDEPGAAREVLEVDCEATNIKDYDLLDLVILQRTAELNRELTGHSRVTPIPLSALKILRKQLNKAHPMAPIVHEADTNPRAVSLWLHMES